MKKHEIYQEAYRLLNNITPIRADCGRLCGQACCNAEDDETGMYLFPYEEVMYERSLGWLRIEETDFTYQKGKNALIALCDPFCDRTLRPLACRIFPILPYLHGNGDLEFILDPRGKGICPLIRHQMMHELNPAFLQRIRLVFKVLLRFDSIYEFVFSLSRQIDEIKLS